MKTTSPTAGHRLQVTDRRQPHVQAVSVPQKDRLVLAQRSGRKGGGVLWADRKAEKLSVETRESRGFPAVDDNGFQSCHRILLARGLPVSVHSLASLSCMLGGQQALEAAFGSAEGNGQLPDYQNIAPARPRMIVRDLDD